MGDERICWVDSSAFGLVGRGLPERLVNSHPYRHCRMFHASRVQALVGSRRTDSAVCCRVVHRLPKRMFGKGHAHVPARERGGYYGQRGTDCDAAEQRFDICFPRHARLSFGASRESVCYYLFSSSGTLMSAEKSPLELAFSGILTSAVSLVIIVSSPMI